VEVLAKDIRPLEREYFAGRREGAVPDLLCFYFEEGAFEMACYLSREYLGQYGQAEFYLMMALAEMGYREEARKRYLRNKEEWYNFCKQNDIYWRHTALYALYFGDYRISGYYAALFDEHYDDCLVQLLGIAPEAEKKAVLGTELFRKASERHPALRAFWEADDGKRKREVLTFEKIQWNIWKKYNEQIGNGERYGIEKVYESDVLKIYSYKPREVTASMHLLTDGETTVMLDCGCEISGTDVVRIPVREILEYLKIGQLDAVFISHAHMDHYGSLNEIRRQRLVMTSVTRQLIRYVSPDVALDCVQTLEGFSSWETGGLRVRFIPNGHILGSVLMDISWKGKARIVYTGDYTAEDQQTVEGLHVEDILDQDSRRIDVLLTETTYGKQKQMLRLGEYEKMFVELCRRQFTYGNKILIPCFAVGRVQEAALLLADMARETGARILIDGLAARITEYYQFTLGKEILNRNISVCGSELDFEEKIRSNDIILASSGMMKEGSTSARYIGELIGQQNVCVMKVGFIRKEEHMLMSILNRRDKNINFIDIPLSAHAGYHSLVDTTEKLSPDCAVYVHGGGIER